jgi:hypothetical protein
MNPFTIAGVVLACLVLLAYLGRAWRIRTAPDLADGLALILGALGITASLRLMGAVFNPDVWTELHVATADIFSITSEDLPMIFVGSFAAIWVAILTIVKSFKNLRAPAGPTPAAEGNPPAAAGIPPAGN